MSKIVKIDLLITVYITCIAIAELMGAKTFPLLKIFDYQLNASVAILVLPVIFTINDIVIEVFGMARAKSIVRSGLFTVSCIMIFSVLASSLPPSARFSKTEPAYDVIFGLSARIAAASLAAFAVAEFLDLIIFSKIRKALGSKRLWLRNNISNFISQFVDTLVFMTLAFYSPGNSGYLWSLILPYWLLKCAMSVIETPLVYLGVRWLKGDET